MRKIIFKKAASLLLASLLLLTSLAIVPFGASATEAKANWLTDNFNGVDTYTIGTPADLLAFKAALNEGEWFSGMTVKLTADIDMSGESWTITSNDSTTYKFSGIFDGCGYSIQNLSATNTTWNTPGVLFTTIDGAHIKNLSMVGGTFSSSRINTGVIAGMSTGKKCTIENVYINYTLERTANVVESSLLISRVSAETEIKNCVVDGEINNAYGAANGGFVGRVKNATVTLTNCAFLGTINYKNATTYMDSFVGMAETGTAITVNCANMGTLNAYNDDRKGISNASGDVTQYNPTDVDAGNFASTLLAYGTAWTQTDKNEMMPAAVATMLGKEYIPANLYYQRAISLNTDGTVDVRFVAVIDSLNYAEVGFNFTLTRIGASGSEESVKVSRSTTEVYESVTALGETVTAEELGGNYVVAIVIKGIDCANYTHDIAVEAFTKDTENSAEIAFAQGTVSFAKTAG